MGVTKASKFIDTYTPKDFRNGKKTEESDPSVAFIITVSRPWHCERVVYRNDQLKKKTNQKNKNKKHVKLSCTLSW